MLTNTPLRGRSSYIYLKEDGSDVVVLEQPSDDQRLVMLGWMTAPDQIVTTRDQYHPSIYGPGGDMTAKHAAALEKECAGEAWRNRKERRTVEAKARRNQR